MVDEGVEEYLYVAVLLRHVDRPSEALQLDDPVSDLMSHDHKINVD